MQGSAIFVNACISLLMILGSGSFLFGMEDGEVMIAGFNFLFGHYWILFFSGILFGILAFAGLIDYSDVNRKNAIKKLEKDIKKLKEKI
mgnify:CR=1 FL=1